MEERITVRESPASNSTNLTIEPSGRNSSKESLDLNLEELGLNISIPIAISADLWLRVLEQFLLLMLIVGRWILPKGSISHDQLSQLLLVYVGTAADIVEFYEAFSENEVKYNRMLCYIILGIWTLSLLQFTLVLTASKARRDQIGLPLQIRDDSDQDGCCNPELYGIVTSIMLQDLPFLCVRLILIFWFHVVSYTNMFFTSKNSLVIILLIYRLIVVHGEAQKRRKKHRQPLKSHSNQNANGNKQLKQIRDNGRSRSTPNVCQTAVNDSLPMHLKKKTECQKKGSTSTLTLPTIYSSDPSLRNLERYRRKSGTPNLLYNAE
ncbi:transmembrane protein 26-like isoform X2 [Dreissena polymorpha]|nr:transmembrane protein 26-like isoform X2 [Dreissena polymorpha]